MNFKSLFRKKSANVILKQSGDGEHIILNRVLTVRDLTFFGIAAIIGGGTFSAIGNARFSGGPAVVFLYVICETKNFFFFLYYIHNILLYIYIYIYIYNKIK